MRRLAGLAAALVIGAAIGLAMYVAAVEISFRMLGNRDELQPSHRRLLDELEEAW